LLLLLLVVCSSRFGKSGEKEYTLKRAEYITHVKHIRRPAKNIPEITYIFIIMLLLEKIRYRQMAVKDVSSASQLLKSDQSQPYVCIVSSLVGYANA